MAPVVARRGAGLPAMSVHLTRASWRSARRRRRFAVVLSICAIFGVLSVAPVEASSGVRIYSDIAQPHMITAGPDGAMWFTTTAGSIGRVDMAGGMTEFPAVSVGKPGDIVAGADGALWFTVRQSHRIGRITTAGHSSLYSGAGIDDPQGIAAGSDDALWFTNRRNNSIGRITTDGVVSNFTGAGVDSPSAIALGSDGALWFTNAANNSIGRITTSGLITNFTGTGIADPQGIVAGPDGALWFTNDNSIGRITTGGNVSTFAGWRTMHPRVITDGPDGAMWFTDAFVGRIGRVTTDGMITKVTPVAGAETLPSDHCCQEPNAGLVGIAVGPDGALWYTINASASIGRITTTGVTSSFLGPLARPDLMAAGPHGDVWFADAERIGRITSAGVTRSFSEPVGPGGIAAGPDGAMWFTNLTGSDFCSSPCSIGRVTTAGHFEFFSLPRRVLSLSNITSGPDGNMWFIASTNSGNSVGAAIGRITMSGVVTLFRLPNYRGCCYYRPGDITAGPDGALWFTNFYTTDGPSIGRISTDGALTSYPVAGHPDHIAAGSDGALWFTNCPSCPGGNGTIGSIERITVDGSITVFTSRLTGRPEGIATAPNGTVWFIGYDTHARFLIGQVTTDGTITNLHKGRTYVNAITEGSGHDMLILGNNRIIRIPVG